VRSRPARAWTKIVRAGDWWDHKLVPLLAVFYGTCWINGHAISSVWPDILLLLGAIVPGAIYVSVVNDLTDRTEDAAAGKPNRMAARSNSEATALVALPLASGLAVAVLWSHSRPLMLAYLGAWISFSLYSLPPVRLKIRGFAGIIADAAGAHLFPSLVSLLLADYATGAGIDPLWTLAVALWSLAYGMRGILWHQLVDVAHDRRAGVRTFAQRLSPVRAAAFTARVAFPVELAALSAMLWRLGPLPWTFLAAYGLLLFVRVHLRGQQAGIVMPVGTSWTMVLQEYYELFLPISVLSASAWIHPLDFLVLAAHLLLFHRRTSGMLRQAKALSRALVAGL
jgi:1,4-dihydroxy-2-naphthoate octaprenyltransferase